MWPSPESKCRANPKSAIFGVLFAERNVGWLQITMHNTIVVRDLHRLGQSFNYLGGLPAGCKAPANFCARLPPGTTP